MYKILKIKQINDIIYLMIIKAPIIAKHCKPGQFIIIKKDIISERIPLTICDYNKINGTITIVFKIIGVSTKKISQMKIGDCFKDIAGPLGCKSKFIYKTIKKLKNENFLFIGGGIGIAPIYSQIKWLYNKNIKFDVIMSVKTKKLIILKKEIKKISNHLYITTDDGTYGYHGIATQMLNKLILNKNKYTKCIIIGPMIMMKFCCMITKKINLPTIVSINPIMIDGTGMCGACRVFVNGKIKFACIDGPEFDGHLIDWNSAIKRQYIYKTEEKKALLKFKYENNT